MQIRQVVNPHLSWYLTVGLVLGFYAPPLALLTPAALAETANPVGNVSVTNVIPAQPAQDASAAPLASGGPQIAPQAQLNSIFQDIEKLVKKFYPKAAVTVSDSKMHIEANCKQEQSFYSDRLVLAPQEGGILCDLELKSGQYQGQNKDRLPSEVQDGFHTNLTMAPYSKLQDKYLLVHLSFPADIDVGFKQRFERLADNFNAQELAAEAASAKTAADQAKKQAAAKKAAAREAMERASQSAGADNQSAFGAAAMSFHRFPEGRIRALFPDDFQTSHSIQMGLAKVDYFCKDPNGTFNVSYIVMPEALDTSEAADSSIKAETILQNMSLGFSKLATAGTPEDAAVLSRMQGRAKALRVGGKDNTAVLRDLTADLEHLSCFVQYQAAVFVRRIETSLVTQVSADDTLSAAGALFDRLAASMIQQVNGTTSQQATISLHGCPGREVIVGGIKGQPNSGALMRIYLRGKYVYEVSAVGEKSWLESPAVNNLIDSFGFDG